MNETTQRISAGKLAAGLALLTVGVAGITSARDLWRWWPLLLIFLGLGHEADALQTRRGSGGYILIAVGVWMLVGSLELFGLTYRDALPIGVVIAGAGMVLHALLGITKENNREQQQ
ncbi:MAG TPA: hypothetical protein VM733_14635 [Thermoanaerobaculia bacterium]|nr:hypothetical protein [Thermoanaerobaculia bacterium]